MEDSNSNISTSSSTIDVASNKSSEEPVSGSGSGTGQRLSSSIDSLPSSTSILDPNVGGSSSNTSFHDNFSNGSSFQEGASSLPGNQSIDPSLPGDQPLDIGVFHPKRKVHGKDKKVCRVCGDKALGYNFNAMTCESCKAFFRRNALKQSTPNCMFQGNCSVDIRTRRFCPHCRLKKCFSMGMKKEMILDNPRGRARLQSVKKRQELTKQESVKDLNKTCAIEIDNQGSKTAAKSGFNQDREIKSFITGSRNHDSTSTASCLKDMKLTLSDQPGPSAAIYKCLTSYRTLTDEDKSFLNVLETSFTTAMKASFTTDVPDTTNPKKKEVNDLYNLAVIWAKMVLKFIKTVDDFKTLDLDTQVCALKGSIRCCIMLIAAYTFDNAGNSFVLQEIKVGVEEFFTVFSMYKDTSERFMEILQSMQDALFKDPYLIAILELVFVFCPAWDDIPQRKCLSDLQSKYLILLKHYLEAKYSYSKEKELFALVLQKCKAIKDITTQRKEIILQLGNDKLEPFARELFGVTDTSKND